MLGTGSSKGSNNVCERMFMKKNQEWETSVVSKKRDNL